MMINSEPGMLTSVHDEETDTGCAANCSSVCDYTDILLSMSEEHA